MDENTIFQLQQQQEKGFRLQRLKQDLESLEESAPHDFGWALRQMRAGKCVKGWKHSFVLRYQGQLEMYYYGPSKSSYPRFGWHEIHNLAVGALLATDWTPCADPEGVE